MEQYTTEGIIVLAEGYLEDNEERCELYFMAEDLYELENIDFDIVYKHFENKGYDCYMDEGAVENDLTLEPIPAKLLVITK